jgi:UDP-N-acetylglucosamine 2-epimerase (non-hydrolysing)
MARLLVVLGTRPEAIKLAPVVRALRDRGAPVLVCVSGQHRELLDQSLAQTGLVPDIDLDITRETPSLNVLAAHLLIALDTVLADTKPDRVIVQGDTTTAMAAALAAHHQGLRVAHVEAGLRSGDNRQPWPEEHNRCAISSIADLHFAPTARAAAALLAQGHAPSSVHVTGNTSIDALLAMRARIARRPGLVSRIQPLLQELNGRRLVLATCHRRENIGKPLAEVAAAIRALSQRKDIVIAMPLHPNPTISRPLQQALTDLPNVILLPALDYPCFVKLLSVAHLVLTDSGGVQEEAPTLGKPCLVLRNKTERSEGVEAGTSRLIGACAERIVAETGRLLDDSGAHARMACPHRPYGDGRAAERIARLLT